MLVFTTSSWAKAHLVSRRLWVLRTTILIPLVALATQLALGAISGNVEAPQPRAGLQADDTFLMLRPAGGPWVGYENDAGAMELLREAEQLERDSKTAEALELYERVIAIRPGSAAIAAVEYRIADMYNYVTNENWVPDPAEAQRRYEEIISRYEPTRSEVLRSHVWLAHLAMFEKRPRSYEEARGHYQAIADAIELLETRPETFAEFDALWAEHLGGGLQGSVTFLERMERADEIHREIERAGGPWIDFLDDPETMELIREADRLDNALRTDEAVAAYERILLMNPGSEANVAIEFRLADIYNYIRNDTWTPDKQEAKRRYEAIVAKYDPTRAEVIRSHYWLGQIYSREGDYAKAREHYEAVADAKELLDSRPEAFHKFDALWAELMSLHIEKHLASAQKHEREQAEKPAAAETPVSPAAGPARTLGERTALRFTLPMPISDREMQAGAAEEAGTNETRVAERAAHRVPRMRVVLTVVAAGILAACFGVVVRERWTQMRGPTAE